MPSLNNTDTEGTISPTLYRQFKRASDTSPYMSDNSSSMLEQSKQLIRALRESQKASEKTLMESEFLSASDEELVTPTPDKIESNSK